MEEEKSIFDNSKIQGNSNLINIIENESRQNDEDKSSSKYIFINFYKYKIKTQA